MNVNVSALLRGRKETGRTRYGNTTTIYYSLKWDIVNRCDCCANLHEYFRNIGIWTWVGMFPICLLLVYLNPGWFFYDYSWFKFAADAVVVGGYIASGFIARWIADSLLTPKGDHKYYDYIGSQGYKTLTQDGYYEITLDYSKNAFPTAVAQSKNRT